MASAEYLSRYLSTGQDNSTSDYASKSKKSKKKSKRTERVKRVSNVQIVDNDVDAANSFLSHLSKNNRTDDEIVGDDEAALERVLANDPNRVLEDGPVIVDESELRGRVDFGDRPRRAPTGTFVQLAAPRRRHDSESSSRDVSPPRRRMRHDSDSEKDDDASSASRDLSPPRRPLVDADGDVSPPRRRPTTVSSSSSDDNNDNRKPTTSTIDAASLAHKSADEVQFAALEARKMKARMSSGASAGLQTASELKADMDRVRREEAERFAKVDAGELGRDAAVVVRDRKGRIVDREQQLAQRAEKEANKPQANKDWSRGLAQLAESKREAEQLANERTSKFARTREDLDEEQRKRKRWGDPSANAAPVDVDNVKKRERSMMAKALDAMNNSGQAQESYNGAWPPNRFDIPPGPHWDGVDRSNGFEKKCFARVAAKEASKVERYHRSVSEM